jgi:glycosyltransferase involved in cell wall biosynthesis
MEALPDVRNSCRLEADMKEKISVFLPVLNEEAILEESVYGLWGFLRKKFESFEIFIVDDGSDDATPEVAGKLRSEGKIRCISFEKGHSKRENLARSFGKSSGNIILYIDADMAANITALPGMAEDMKNYDIIIGSRYVKGSAVRRKLSRRAISTVYNALIRIIFKSKIRDHQCGFKAFRRKALFSLLDEMGYDRDLKRGWFWDAEILIRAQRRHFRIKEVPVS